MLAIATAVNVVVTGDDPTPAALLDGYRAALVVPLAGVTIGAAITAAGFRRARDPLVEPTATALAGCRSGVTSPLSSTIADTP
jgi:hypothetical protein